MTVRELITRLGFKIDERGINEAEKKLAAAGKRMKTVGKALSFAVTAPIVAISGFSLKASIDFNKAMANIATLIPDNAERVQELKKGIQDLSIATGKSTGDLADGMYQVISAFGDSADSLKILEINARAGTAGVATTLDAINLTSAVTKNYGDTSAAASQKAADLAFKTVELGQTTFPELANAIGRVAPLTAQLGLSQEDLFTGFAALTGVTGDAARVSTQLSAVLNGMLEPSDSMALAIEDLGYENSNAMLSSLGFLGSLKALIGETDRSSEAIAGLFGRQEALLPVFALNGKLADDYTVKSKKMNNVLGATDIAYKEQTEGANKTGHALDVLKARSVVMAQNLGDALAPALLTILDKIDPLIKKVEKLAIAFRKADADTQNFVIAIGAVLAVIGPLMIYLTKIIEAFTKLAPLFRTIGALIAIALPIADIFEWKKGNIAVMGDLFGEYPGPFSKGNLTKKANEFIKGLNTLFTAGLNYGFGFPEPIPYFTPAFAGAPAGTVNNVQGGNVNVNVNVPPGTNKEQADFIANTTKKIVREEQNKMIRQVQHENPDIE